MSKARTTLTNRQAELAHMVKDATERFRRSSLEAHAAYLEAGHALAEARSEAKKGEWRPFLEAAGVGERTARHMMQIARSGAVAETVATFGGVRALLEWLRVADRIVEAERFALLNFAGDYDGSGYMRVASQALAATCGVKGMPDVARLA